MSIVDLIRLGTLDPVLGALAWRLVEGRVPVLVAARMGGVGKTTLLDALLELLPDEVRTVTLRGESETFDWLPESDPRSTVIVAPELSDHLPIYTWGRAAHAAIRAASRGFGLAATIHADSLEEVLDSLGSREVGAGADELSYLGLVLVLRAVRRAPRSPDGSPARRVVAAHYLRPVARDAGGHVQRLGPAVLSTWAPATDSFEDFSWGILPELAVRLGVKAGDLEADLAARRDLLRVLAASGSPGPAVRAAVRAYRSPAIS